MNASQKNAPSLHHLTWDHPPKIDVVESDPSGRAAIDSFLRREGFTIQSFGDGESFLKSAAHDAPEIVLLGLICVVLLVDLFVDAEKKVITFWISIASLVVTAWTLAATAPEARTVMFTGSYVSDSLSQVLKLFAGFPPRKVQLPGT